MLTAMKRLYLSVWLVCIILVSYAPHMTISFEKAEDSYLVIKSPLRNDVLMVGDVIDIQWRTMPDVAHVPNINIELWYSSPAVLRKVKTLAKNINNTNSFAWTVGASVLSEEYALRIWGNVTTPTPTPSPSPANTNDSNDNNNNNNNENNNENNKNDDNSDHQHNEVGDDVGVNTMVNEWSQSFSVKGVSISIDAQPKDGIAVGDNFLATWSSFDPLGVIPMVNITLFERVSHEDSCVSPILHKCGLVNDKAVGGEGAITIPSWERSNYYFYVVSAVIEDEEALENLLHSQLQHQHQHQHQRIQLPQKRQGLEYSPINECTSDDVDDDTLKDLLSRVPFSPLPALPFNGVKQELQERRKKGRSNDGHELMRDVHVRSTDIHIDTDRIDASMASQVFEWKAKTKASASLLPSSPAYYSSSSRMSFSSISPSSPASPEFQPLPSLSLSLSSSSSASLPLFASSRKNLPFPWLKERCQSMPDPFIHDGDHGNDNDKVDKNENIIDIDIDIDEDVIDDGSGDSGDDDGENSDEGDAGHYVSAHRKKAHARHDKGSSQRRREYLRSENDRADDDVPSEFPLIISAQSRDFVVIGPSLDMHVHNVSTALDAGTTVMIDWSGFSPRGVMARLDLYLVNVSSGGYRILDTLPLHNVVRSEEDIINGTMHVSLPPEIPDGQYIFELRGTLAPGSDQQWTRFISCHSVNFHLNGAKLQPRDLDAPKLVLDRFKSNVVPVLWDLFNPGNLIDTVRLFIHCVDSGKEFEIADNIGNSGKYKWVVSLEIPSGFYRLHVRPSHRDTGNVVSLTTSTFEIMNPIIPDPNRQIDDAVAIEYIAIGCTLFFIVFLTLAVCVCRDDKKEVDVFDKSSLLLPDDKLNPDSKTSHISPSHTFQHHHSSHNRHHGGQHPSHAHVNGHVNAHREMFPEGKYNHHNLHRPFLRHQGGAY